ncbi:MAG TPA: hypothetical protein VD947_03990 [Patescibacteria group bacterium]|nr:hypothetical protein [Patescibacteria group bacterium]
MSKLVLDNDSWGNAQDRQTAQAAIDHAFKLLCSPALEHYLMKDIYFAAPEVDWLRMQGTTTMGPLWEVKLTHALDLYVRSVDETGFAQPDPGTLAGGRFSYPDIDIEYSSQKLRIELKAWWVQSEEASGRFKEPIELIKPYDLLAIPYWDFSQGNGGNPMLLEIVIVSAWEAAYLRNQRTTSAGGVVGTIDLPRTARSAKLANGLVDTNFGKLDRLNHPVINEINRFYPSPRRLISAFSLRMPGDMNDFHMLFQLTEAAIKTLYPTSDDFRRNLEEYTRTASQPTSRPSRFECIGMFYRLWMSLDDDYKSIYQSFVESNASLKYWLQRAWWVK